ncbi:MAG TPA: rod shape-determining protein MreC [Bryobacteraceae bacterium]|jgi:rod shape-determining protein MreC|nr:rod shape-determining protein MreC [Bryobacteraceae bacterium]
MEFLLNRYRNLMVLVAAILLQLVLLAYQVKSKQEVRLIRVWAVTAVTPLARVTESFRSNVAHFFSDYFVLLDVREDNKRMKAEMDRIKMENQFLRTELSTADRARSLAIFQSRSPSRTVAAHIIGNTTGSGGKVVIVDRGTASGIEKGMAVITPDGIVGKIIAVYPTASLLLLITDPSFAAGVISQKNRVHGTLKGQDHSTVKIDYVQNEENVEPGEWFFTSGDDRIFPKGLPAGQATVVRPGSKGKEIFVTPSGFQNGLEEVLIIVGGVHADIPATPPGSQAVHLLPPPPGETAAPVASAPAQSGPLTTDADKVLDRYRQVKHTYGERGKGAPNFNAPVESKTPPIDNKTDATKQPRNP